MLGSLKAGVLPEWSTISSAKDSCRAHSQSLVFDERFAHSYAAKTGQENSGNRLLPARFFTGAFTFLPSEARAGRHFAGGAAQYEHQAL
jgi:hypothetical protein